MVTPHCTYNIREVLHQMVVSSSWAYHLTKQRFALFNFMLKMIIKSVKEKNIKYIKLLKNKVFGWNEMLLVTVSIQATVLKFTESCPISVIWIEQSFIVSTIQFYIHFLWIMQSNLHEF